MDVKRDSFRWLIIKAEGLEARSGVVSTPEPGRRPPRRFYKLFSSTMSGSRHNVVQKIKFAG